ncbi:MAG: isopentenyl-diphosphate Delta-isomerase [Planctomycetaceae bacterium]
MEESVIIVNENNVPVGTCPKRDVHGADTMLHRGFSVFVFDHSGRFLIQQRSGFKKTWPLVWSNSCCGHPQPGETAAAAVQRRLHEELGITECVSYEIVPDYRYKAVFNGVMENEFCPVWVAWYAGQPKPNSEEVAQLQWIDWRQFIESISAGGDHAYKGFSVWCLEESLLINGSERFRELWRKHVEES